MRRSRSRGSRARTRRHGRRTCGLPSRMARSRSSSRASSGSRSATRCRGGRISRTSRRSKACSGSRCSGSPPSNRIRRSSFAPCSWHGCTTSRRTTRCTSRWPTRSTCRLPRSTPAWPRLRRPRVGPTASTAAPRGGAPVQVRDRDRPALPRGARCPPRGAPRLTYGSVPTESRMTVPSIASISAAMSTGSPTRSASSMR